MDHYKITNESKINDHGVKVYRIELKNSCQYGKAGDKGGWIQDICNLIDGWVDDEAEVFGPAKVFGGLVDENAKVFNRACIYQDAHVSDYSTICGCAVIEGYSQVGGRAIITGNSKISGHSIVLGDSIVGGSCHIYGETALCDGNWLTTPIQIQGSKHFINICSPDKIKIGCKVHSFKFWREHYETIGKQNGYTYDQIEEYKNYIDIIINKYKK